MNDGACVAVSASFVCFPTGDQGAAVVAVAAVAAAAVAPAAVAAADVALGPAFWLLQNLIQPWMALLWSAGTVGRVADTSAIDSNAATVATLSLPPAAPPPARPALSSYSFWGPSV